MADIDLYKDNSIPIQPQILSPEEWWQHILHSGNDFTDFGNQKWTQDNIEKYSQYYHKATLENSPNNIPPVIENSLYTDPFPLKLVEALSKQNIEFRILLLELTMKMHYKL